MMMNLLDYQKKERDKTNNMGFNQSSFISLVSGGGRGLNKIMRREHENKNQNTAKHILGSKLASQERGWGRRFKKYEKIRKDIE